ncbi:MAG: DNA gyrase modulator [Microthrixaceae bacterium]
MSPDELMEVAERVLAMAAPEEQVEVVAAHSRDTEVRAYDGEIEAFTSAESAGFGVRVIRGHRQGFAYAGTLDADVVAETLGEARDNAAFSTVDEFTGLVEPDGVAEVTLHLYDEALAGLGPDRKIELALELERLVCAGDPRILGVEMAEYADSIETAVIASTTGIRSISRETGCSLAAYSLAGVDDDVTTGFGFSVGRGLDDLDLEDTAGRPSSGPSECWAPVGLPAADSPWCSTPG